jgi:hypothetical protein
VTTSGATDEATGNGLAVADADGKVTFAFQRESSKSGGDHVALSGLAFAEAGSAASHVDVCDASSENKCDKDHGICTKRSSSAEMVESATFYAGKYLVMYKGQTRTSRLHVDCDMSTSGVGAHPDALHFDADGLSKYCSNTRDTGATMYILRIHGMTKYECLKKNGANMVGNHYGSMNAYWGYVAFANSHTLFFCAKIPAPPTLTHYSVFVFLGASRTRR